MQVSEFCIRRPVFTTLLMAALFILGISGYRTLSVSALPNIDFPTIQVSASLAGASAETMAVSVAMPLEREFSTISGLSSMTSSSTLGSTNVTLQFDLNRDIDGAALDVQTAISGTLGQLPKEMQTPPSFKKVNPAAAPIIFIALSSDSLSLSTLSDYADTLLSERISMIPGVAQTTIYGEKKYALRIQADPDQLAAKGLGFNQIEKMIAASTSISPLGTIQGPKQLFNIEVKGQPQTAKAFRELIAVWKNGAPVRLGDIATIVDDVADRYQSGFMNGKPAIVIAIQRQSDANTIEVVERVRSLLPLFRSQLPASVEMTPLFDRSISIKNSVTDVQRTLFITFILVIFVIYLFLGSIRATLIPAVAVPLSVIATYGGMALLGFSINNISLLALTLCVGFVVDDAIVMLENIMRHIENGEKPLDAALMGAREIGFTIVSMTISLVAVFIPVLFMGGVVGRLFKEFAVTISMAVLFSGLIALTLTPMLCSKMLKSHKAETGMAIALENGFQWMLALYQKTLQKVLLHRRIMLFATFGLFGMSILAFMVAPKGFFPLEDTGFVLMSTEAAQDISFEAMLKKQQRLAAIIAKNPAVETVFCSTGGGGPMNAGRLFFGLKPKSDRASIFSVMQQLRQEMSVVEGIRTYMQPIQNIQIGGRSSKGFYQYTLQGDDLSLLYAWSEKLLDALGKEPQIQELSSDMQLNSLKVIVDIDQERAASLGVTDEDVRQALYSAYGNLQVATLYTAANTYPVIFEISWPLQKSLEDLGRIYVAGSAGSGQVVPLGAIATFSRGSAALLVNHQGQLPSVTFSFNLPPGVSLGEVVERIQGIQHQLQMPESITGGFQGVAQAFTDSLSGQGWLLLITIMVIYIILGMLYESFIHPITILSGLPSAGLGAVVMLILFGMDVSVISIIGIILLIGIVKKNSIMIIDFAIRARKEGLEAEEAILQACLLRFRPIMMTTMAAILGTLPIALAIGHGSELRQPLGVAVVGGLLVSQLLTLFITPVIYLYLDRFSARD